MNKKIITGALLSTLSFAVLADNPSFDYIDLGYSNWDLDNSSSINGFEIKGSKLINDNFYIAGDVNRVTNDGNTLTVTTLGFGYKNNLSDVTSYFAELDYANLNSDLSSSNNGYEVTAGFRSMVMPNLELKGALEYLYTNSSARNKSNSAFVVGGVYNFTDTFSTYLDYKVDADLNRLAVGVRFNF